MTNVRAFEKYTVKFWRAHNFNFIHAMRVPEKTLKVATGLQLTTGSSCFSGRVRMFKASLN